MRFIKSIPYHSLSISLSPGYTKLCLPSNVMVEAIKTNTENECRYLFILIESPATMSA